MPSKGKTPSQLMEALPRDAVPLSSVPSSQMERIFLLSPARSQGRRAALLTRPQAKFELARQLQIGDATLGDVYAFCSGLYFRGKLTYARRFARPPQGHDGVLIITPSRGLLRPEHRIGIRDLMEFAAVDVDAREPRFAEPLRDSARALIKTSSECEIILLGSIATSKYVDVLLPILGECLRFPSDFVGRGDMSRGGLLLRSVAAGEELDYSSVAGAIRKGRRPPKLEASKRIL
jgi:hypothetical protein